MRSAIVDAATNARNRQTVVVLFGAALLLGLTAHLTAPEAVELFVFMTLLVFVLRFFVVLLGMDESEDSDSFF